MKVKAVFTLILTSMLWVCLIILTVYSCMSPTEVFADGVILQFRSFGYGIMMGILVSTVSVITYYTLKEAVK